MFLICRERTRMAIFGDSYQQAIIDEPRQPNDKPPAGFMDLSTTNEDCRSNTVFAVGIVE